MKKYIRILICFLYSFIKLNLIKIWNFNKLKFSHISFMSPFTEIELGKNSKLILGKFVKSRSGTKIKVRENAIVTIGNNTSFNYRSMVISHDSIKIGNNVQIGPNVLIYDHDHKFKEHNDLKNLLYETSPISIGNNVWIGANTIILRGTIIGDNSVVAAGSILKGKYESNSIIVQKRHTQVKSKKEQ